MGMENVNSNRKPKAATAASKVLFDKCKLWPPIVLPAFYDISRSYDWKDYLERGDFDATPVQAFNHVPLHDVSRFIVTGIKVEVPNKDYWLHAGSIGGVFWIANVVKICGYKILLRYEGVNNEDTSNDFWMNLCSSDLHSVGWCAKEGKPLVPPKLISDKPIDWKTFLVKKLTGAKTLPTNFQDRVKQSLICKLRRGSRVEVIDRNQLSRYRPGIVDEIVGRRVRVSYVDPEEPEHQAENGPPSKISNIWCDAYSPSLKAVGWAMKVGAPIHCTEEYKKKCQEKLASGSFEAADATEDYFAQGKNAVKGEDETRYANLTKFQENMKMEALDVYNNFFTIATASVLKVLDDGYMQITFDGTGDTLVVHSSSPYIYPVGFCESTGIQLAKPEGYEKTFNWETYLKETKSVGAPDVAFNTEQIHHLFKVGQKLEATDNVDPHLICVATIAEVRGRLLRIHYDGWADNFDQWVDATSAELFPVGWCEAVGYPLEAPVGDTVLRGKRLNSSGTPKGKKHKKAKYEGRKGSEGATDDELESSFNNSSSIVDQMDDD